MRPLIHALLLGLLLAACGRERGSDEPLIVLGQALASERLIEGRLSVSPAFRPCAAPAATGGRRCESQPQPATLTLLLRARQRAEQSGEARARALTGLLGTQQAADLDRPIALLELLAQEHPADRAAILADTAAAYVRRATLGGDGRDLLLALERADEALEVSPGLPAAAFNRALALERLHVVRRAAAAWESYRQLDPASGWGEEAELRRRRLAALDQASQEGSNARLLASAEASDSELKRIVGQLPEELADAALRLVLADWARAVLRQDDAAARHHLERLARIGSALRSSADDPFVTAVGAHIQSLSDPARRQLAAGWLRVLSAIDLVDGWQTVEAAEQLAPAENALRSLHSPLALPALRYRATCAYQAHTPAEANDLAGRLLAEAQAAGFRDLTGRAGWLLGLMALSAVDLDTAERHLEAARQQFATISASRLEAGVLSLLAATSAYVADSESAWRRRVAALDRMVAAGVSKRYPVLIGAAARDASKLGFHRAARELAEEAFSFDSATGEPLALVETLHQLATVQRAGGWDAEATKNLDLAFAELPAVRPDSVRRHTRAALLAERGVLAAKSFSAQALPPLNEALELYASEQYSLSQPELRSARARVQLALGNSAAADAELVAVLEELTRQAAKVAKLDERVRLMDQMAPALETLVALRLERGDSAAQTLALAESIHDRWLNEAPTETVAERLDGELTAATTGHTVLVKYLPLQSGLAWWVSAGGRLRAGVLPLPAARLATLVAAFQDALTAGDVVRLQRASGELHHAILTPLALPADADLVLVAAGDLGALPWAALTDPRTGRYLIEDHALVVAPSARLYLRSRQGLAAPRAPLSGSALVLGDPAFSHDAHPLLSRLPGAAREARAVAARLPASRLYEGDAATVDVFMTGLGRHAIVHFSGHARSVPHPLYSDLLFAATADGRRSTVRAGDIYGRRVSGTQLVTLAACSSATGYRSAIEGSLGLGQALLSAGVPAVLATLWPVPDGDTRHIVEPFYDALAGTGIGNAAAALRSAQLSALRSPDPRAANPRLWAAFQLMGASTNDPIH